MTSGVPARNNGFSYVEFVKLFDHFEHILLVSEFIGAAQRAIFQCCQETWVVDYPCQCGGPALLWHALDQPLEMRSWSNLQCRARVFVLILQVERDLVDPELLSEKIVPSAHRGW